MNMRQALFRTLVAVVIAATAFAYAMFVVPNDYLIDIREAVITIGAFTVAVLILASAWASLALHALRNLVGAAKAKLREVGHGKKTSERRSKAHSSRSESH